MICFLARLQNERDQLIHLLLIFAVRLYSSELAFWANRIRRGGRERVFPFCSSNSRGMHREG